MIRLDIGIDAHLVATQHGRKSHAAAADTAAADLAIAIGALIVAGIRRSAFTAVAAPTVADTAAFTAVAGMRPK